MRCLSVRQPWTWSIIHGAKRIENRRWSTSHRGPLLIHAARSLAEFGPDYSRLMPGLPPIEGLDFGAIIGMVDVVDCVPLAEVEDDPFATGPRCWILENPRSIEPIPWMGQQGLFDVPDDFMRGTAPAGRRTRKRP